jgi:hypothetical protein
MTPPDHDAMEEWQIGDVEPVLYNLKAEIAILGHLINTPDEAESSTWAWLEDALTDTHAALEAAQAERAMPQTKRRRDEAPL